MSTVPTCKTPIKAPGFFAVRRGVGYLRNAIFLNWEDCYAHVFRGVSGVEYAVFETVEDAINYLSQPMIPPSQAGQQLVATKRKAPPAATAATSNKRSRAEKPPPAEKEKTPKKTKKPSNAWEIMFSRMKERLEAKNLHEDEDEADLERWIRQQRNGYRNMHGDKKTLMGMTVEKADRLKELDFDFQYFAWEDRFRQIQDFLKVNPGTSSHKTEELLVQQNKDLAKWYSQQKSQYRAFSKGRPCKLDAPQIHQLKSIGFGTENKKLKSDDFTEMFEELREYKRQNDHCNVLAQTKDKNTRLGKWVLKQRAQYKLLKDGKSSRMTTERMIKLTDLGFVFVPKGRNPSWEERIGECRKHHAQHGNIRFPAENQAMRTWICRVRGDYRLFKEGSPSNITQEKIDTMNGLGMIWDTGFAFGPMLHQRRKTWDQRFEDLLKFIRENGHSVVPQATPGLGKWVHTQRMEYKSLQQGKETLMTSEKALKLVSIGFVFDAKNKRGKQTEVYGDSYA
mmetsp:Transcript_2980/g.4850  ORF Transcript_2980/g.4850 Transcript_2980/m.4850 type:complete len:508 (+) Transcript_2980:105-1628(+)